LVQVSVPLFERVLSDLQRPLLPTRFKTELDWSPNGYDWAVPCIWPGGERPYPEDDEIAEDEVAYGAWLDEQPRVYPELLGKYSDQWDTVNQTVGLYGREIQVRINLYCAHSTLSLCPFRS